MTELSEYVVMLLEEVSKEFLDIYNSTDKTSCGTCKVNFAKLKIAAAVVAKVAESRSFNV